MSFITKKPEKTLLSLKDAVSKPFSCFHLFVLKTRSWKRQVQQQKIDLVFVYMHKGCLFRLIIPKPTKRQSQRIQFQQEAKEDNTCNRSIYKIWSQETMQSPVMKIYIWPCWFGRLVYRTRKRKLTDKWEQATWTTPKIFVSQIRL